MLGDPLALLARAEQDRPGLRRDVAQYVTLWMIAEWGTLLSAMAGIAALREGRSTGPAFIAFIGANALSLWTRRTASLAMFVRFTELARSRVASIAGRLHRLPLLEFERIGKGVLVTRLAGDGNRLSRAGKPTLNVFLGVGRLGIGFGFVAWQSTTLAAATAAVGLLAFLAALGQLDAMSRGFREIADHEADLFDNLKDQQGGAVGLRLHRGRRRALARHYRQMSDRLARVREDIWSTYFERQFAYSALIYALLGINVFILPRFVPLDNALLRESNLVVLALFFGLTNLIFGLPTVGRGARAAERLDALAEKLADDRLEPAQHAVGPGRFADFRTLRTEGLRFTYPARGASSDAGFSVGPADLEFRRGEVVYVVGHNGSGKSTFLRMLCGLYRAQAGRIIVDDTPVAPADLPHLRALFGTIFVDHRLFDRVVDGTAPDVAARAPTLFDEMGLAGKSALVDGRLTETALSTGQKKRLAMVVARLRDRPIFLLDEWAADQDPAFRRYYYETLIPQLRDAGKLVIVVTHDDQHFGLADRVVRLEEGRVVSDERRRP